MNANSRALTVLRLAQVQSRTGLSRSSIYQKISEGSFPLQVSLGPRSVGWIESEIDDWVEKQILRSRVEPTKDSINSGTLQNMSNQIEVRR
jgi:prophage regulatory protein